MEWAELARHQVRVQLLQCGGDVTSVVSVGAVDLHLVYFAVGCVVVIDLKTKECYYVCVFVLFRVRFVVILTCIMERSGVNFPQHDA